MTTALAFLSCLWRLGLLMVAALALAAVAGALLALLAAVGSVFSAGLFMG